MSFTQAIKTCYSKYFDFSGRASRSEYWFFVLFVIILTVILIFIGTSLSKTSNMDDIQTNFIVMQLILLFATYIPSLSVLVRRLHDTGKSGWMVLTIIIPLVGAIMSVLLLVWACKKGDPGENNFGLPPRPESERKISHHN